MGHETRYRALTAFITRFGTVTSVGVEGTGSYGAGLARYLAANRIEVAEVLRPSRQVRRMRGKSDEIDAYAAAETALSGRGCSTPKHGDRAVEAMRVLTAARRSAIKAATQASAQIQDLLVCAPDSLRARFRVLRGTHLITALATTRMSKNDDLVTRTTRRTLRALARRFQDLRNEITGHDQALTGLVTRVNPALLQAKGVGLVCAADLLVTAGDNPTRIRSEAAFSRLCGAAPIPASSGKTVRHRLNRGGDRKANCALYHIAVVRLHSDPRIREYAQRRRAQGHTTTEIIRCLKRAIARETYRLITSPPAPIDTIRLRPMRHAAYLTLTRAAHDLGCSISGLSHLEHGYTTSTDRITRYRDYLTAHQNAA